jgi:hypothetical protein
MLFAVEVHQIELIDQSMPFQQGERPIDGHTINVGSDFAGTPENLRRIQVLLRSLYNAQDGAALAGHAQPARH